MRELTVSELERSQPQTDEALQMDPDTFHTLYERTARPLWVYLWRRTGSEQTADDLLQETYYRLLRARVTHETEAHRRNYLFRIATNLVTDLHRSRREHVKLPGETERGHPVSQPQANRESQPARDLDRALSKLSSRQRDALWLAYAEGSSHAEIADALGLKPGSVRLILFRARRKLARLLREGGKR